MSETRVKKAMPWWLETLVMIGTALLLAVLLKTFLVQAFYIPSESMEPMLVENDKLLVQKVSYWGSSPERGDVIVFKDTAAWLGVPNESGPRPWIKKTLVAVGLYPTGGHLIKRVIGVGGDEIACCDDRGRTTVNGEPIDEPYLASQDANSSPTFHVEVPKGYLWVQGDNRGHSADSRAHMGRAGGGFVPESAVVGKAWLRVWPLSRWGTFDKTDAFSKVEP